MKEQTTKLLEVKNEKDVALKKVADYLADMIESGNTEIEEKMIACNKTIEDCFKYILFEAKKEAVNNSAMVDDATVYGWATHYYEENGKPEGYEEKKAPKASVSTTSSKPKVTEVKKEVIDHEQISLF